MTMIPRQIQHLICREILLGKSDLQILQTLRRLNGPPPPEGEVACAPAERTRPSKTKSASPNPLPPPGEIGPTPGEGADDLLLIQPHIQRLRKNPRALAEGRALLEAEVAQIGLALPAARLEMLNRLAHALEQRVLEEGSQAAIAEYKELRETLKQIADEAQNGAAEISPIAEIRRLLSPNPQPSP